MQRPSKSFRAPRTSRAFFTIAFLAGIVMFAEHAVAQSSAWRNSPFSPLPAIPDLDVRKVRLGEKLFHDPRLSADDTISCATCHDLAHGGGDGRAKPIGIAAQEGEVNTPTVFNSALNFSQFWDGRAENLEEQAAGPVHNPVEMASNWLDIEAKLSADPEMQRAFAELYGGVISDETIVDAIATFERTLITLDAPFDRYLKGDDTAISDQAKRGHQLFLAYGCASCHQGANVGGNMYQTMGAMGDYFGDRGNVTDSDQGRFQVTGRDRDRHVFKVPSLRMAAHTAPYFHDGSAKTLEDAVSQMAKYQLGRELPSEDLAPIVAFLHSLAGQYKRYAP